MKLIIAGSRGLDFRLAYVAIDAFIRKNFSIGSIAEVVSGTARDVDKTGEQWASDHGIPVKKFPADWKKLGLSAGYVRNSEMGAYGDRALVLWDGSSRGSKNMIDVMRKLGKPVDVISMEGDGFREKSDYDMGKVVGV